MADLHDFLRRHPRLFVLSGAGVSTDSGIPGYRDDEGRWMRQAPVTLQEFLGSASARQRYWARSMVGFPVVARATPNAAHRALARLETARKATCLVTQNVDGLHQRAGSANVIELHGTVGRVICLECGAAHARASDPADARSRKCRLPRGAGDRRPRRRCRRRCRSRRCVQRAALRALRRDVEAGRRVFRRERAAGSRRRRDARRWTRPTPCSSSARR